MSKNPAKDYLRNQDRGVREARLGVERKTPPRTQREHHVADISNMNNILAAEIVDRDRVADRSRGVVDEEDSDEYDDYDDDEDLGPVALRAISRERRAARRAAARSRTHPHGTSLASQVPPVFRSRKRARSDPAQTMPPPPPRPPRIPQPVPLGLGTAARVLARLPTWQFLFAERVGGLRTGDSHYRFNVSTDTMNRNVLGQSIRDILDDADRRHRGQPTDRVNIRMMLAPVRGQDGNNVWVSTGWVAYGDLSIEGLVHLATVGEDYDGDMDVVNFTVSVSNEPSGGTGFAPTTITNIANGRKKKIINIVTKPGFHDCAARSLCVIFMKRKSCRISSPDDSTSHDSNYTRSSSKRQKDDSLWLCTQAGIDPRSPVVFSDLVKFCECGALGTNARIAVISPSSGASNFSIVYKTRNLVTDEPDPPPASLYTLPIEQYRQVTESNWYFLLFTTNPDHYSAVLSPNCVWNTPKFCNVCMKGYHRDDAHKCLAKCSCCLKTHCHGYRISVTGEHPSDFKWSDPCPRCNRTFFGNPNLALNACYQNHLDGTCGKVYKCTDPRCAGKTFSAAKCSIAEHTHGETVWCNNCKLYTDPNHPCYLVKPKLKEVLGKVERVYYFDFETSQQNGEHVVNHSETQDHTGSEVIIHKSISEFCDWVFTGFGERSGFTMVAHNGRGYDFQFIRREAIVKHQSPVKCIRKGTKIVYMVFSPTGTSRATKHDIRFIDSLNFLTMPLSKLPKTFGLEELVKGFFCHWFNTDSNQEYRGMVPHWEYFRPNNFAESSFQAFLKWYPEEVLRTSRSSRDAVLRIRDFEVTYNYKCAATIFETIRFEKDWVFADEISKYCHSDVTILRQACELYRTEFLTLFPDDTVPGLDPFKSVTITSMCQKLFMAKWYKNKSMGVFSYVDQAWMRRAFHGGRTEAKRLLYSVSGDTELFYRDITSLYPFVNKTRFYPTGHPVWIDNVDTLNTKLLEWGLSDTTVQSLDEGVPHILNHGLSLVECSFKAPQTLLHPLLPAKDADTGKLVFDNKPHADEVVASPELFKAQSLGYRIYNVKRFCVWPPTQCSDSMFSAYVDTLLKIKYEAKGWDGCVTSEEKQEYLDELKHGEGLELNPDRVQANPGKYAIAKTSLNSLWGKFVMRPNLPTTTVFYKHDIAEYWDHLTDDSLVTDRFILIPGESVEVVSRAKSGKETIPRNTNITIGIFTTSWARLQLYDAIEKLGDQVCYMDTDSVIYFKDPHNPSHIHIPVGKKLGEFTDEFDISKYKMIEFVSGGPKNYGYLLQNRVTGEIKNYCKVKGFNLYKGVRLDNSAHKLINYDHMKLCVHLNVHEPWSECTNAETSVTVEDSQIRRDRIGKVFNADSTRTYQWVFDKGLIDYYNTTDNDIPIKPFGYYGNDMDQEGLYVSSMLSEERKEEDEEKKEEASSSDEENANGQGLILFLLLHIVDIVETFMCVCVCV